MKGKKLNKDESYRQMTGLEQVRLKCDGLGEYLNPNNPLRSTNEAILSLRISILTSSKLEQADATK